MTRIARTPFIITTSILFALALFTTALRFALRLQHSHTLHLDDLVLTLSILCLIAGTAVVYPGLSGIYSVTESTNPFQPTSSVKAFECLLWSTVYSVKAAFLVTFKQSVYAICPRGKIYYAGVWVAVLGCWVFEIAVPFVSKKEGVVRILAYIGTAIDIVTLGLVLSLSLPTIILNRPFTIRQKASFIAVGTLSLCITTITILRSVYIRNSYSSSLLTFLTFSEGCIAIITVSILALGITLNGHASINHNVHTSIPDWLPGALTRKRSKTNLGSEVLLNETNIIADGDSVTGLRTMVRGGTPELPQNPSPIHRNESVLRTREVVVQVQYGKDLEKSDWDRVTSPRWVDHKWEQSSQSSLSGN